MNYSIIAAFVLYFSILISIGIYFYRRSTNSADFMVGNRSVNYWVTAIATQASDMGSWLFLGFPAVVFAKGLFEYWTAIGLVVGMYLTWQFVAPQLRLQTAALNSLTLTSFFADRVHDRTGRIQLVSTIATLIYCIFYIASGLVGLSIVFESAFGITYHTGMITSLITVLLYTLIGGFVAVAWCDFFQGIFLLAMIFLVPIVAVISMGGIGLVIAAAHAKGVSLSLLSSSEQMVQAILLAAGWGLGYFGQPHILVNFMGIDDPKKITAAKRVGITWQIMVLSAAAAVGIIGIGFFHDGLANDQLVFVTMTTSLFHSFFAGLVLCAIFAATLSTLDSLILVSGSTVAEDIYKQFISKKATQKMQVFVSRISSVVTALVALLLAWHSNASVYNLVNYAWAGLGSSFGPLMLCSLYYSRLTRLGALSGIITGALVSGFWPLINTTVLPLVPGFFASLVAIIIVSWAEGTFTKDHHLNMRLKPRSK